MLQGTSELKESQKKTDNQLRELKESQQRFVEERREAQKRIDAEILELKKSQDRTDAQLQETDKLLNKTIKKLDEIGRQLGDLGLVQGEVAEDLFYRNVRSLFKKERDMIFDDVKRNLKKRGAGEYDIIPELCTNWRLS